jgi:hypothetical protein
MSFKYGIFQGRTRIALPLPESGEPEETSRYKQEVADPLRPIWQETVLLQSLMRSKTKNARSVPRCYHTYKDCVLA